MDMAGANSDRAQPHLKCMPGQVAEFVLLCGDVDRVEKIRHELDESRLISKNREFLLYTGRRDKTSLSICSTGIGAPSAAIAVEELGRCGARVFIRVGSAGALQPDIKAGDIVILTGAFRGDGTSRRYVPLPYPAVSDVDVTCALIEGAKNLGIPVRVGLGMSEDAFYATSTDEVIRFSSWNILAIEMEASVLMVLASLRGWKAGAIVAIDGSPLLGQTKSASQSEAFREAERKEILIALEALDILNERRAWLEKGQNA